MNKIKISICLSFIFIIFIATPSVISVIDKSIDISMFYGVNEEENNNNYELKHKEISCLNSYKSEIFFLELQKKDQFDFYFNNYTQLSQETHSPPPDYFNSNILFIV